MLLLACHIVMAIAAIVVGFYATPVAAHPTIVQCSQLGPQLEVAIRNGDTQTLRSLVSRGIHVSGYQLSIQHCINNHVTYQQDGASTNETLLSIAASLGRAAAAGVLLQYGADPMIPRALEHQPLYVASKQGHSATVGILLLFQSVVLTIRSQAKGGGITEGSTRDGNYYSTPTLAAASGGHAAVVRMLLAHGATWEISLHPTQLMVAAASNCETIDVLLAAGIRAKEEPFAPNPLVAAARAGCACCVGRIVDQEVGAPCGNDAAWSGRKHCSEALEVAALRCHVDTVRVLLRSSADVRFCKHCRGSRQHCSIDNSKAVEDLFLLYGSKLLALFEACGTGSTTTIHQLLAIPANGVLHVNSVNATGTTALMVAAAAGRDEVADLLLNKLHANVNATDAHGATALHFAAHKKNVALCRSLLDAGAYVDARAANGERPLLIAIAAADLDLVRLHVEHGATLNGTLSAVGSLNMQISTFLLASGAKT